MSWIAYKIVLRLQTPMHIGRAKLGNLQATRPYVHGKALWGALTARITRESTPARAQDYQAIGRQVTEQMAFSYFYPTTGEEVTLWPWDDRERFAWRFLGSYASTALNYSQNSAQEGSLHETEFIAPRTWNGQPVYLVGYIFQKEGSALPWRDALQRLQIGGERTYGWGRVNWSGEAQPALTLFDYPLDLSRARPVISIPKDKPLLAHALAHGEGAISVIGRLAPLVGRETRAANAHGRHLSSAIICWEPGGRVEHETRVAIDRFGLWYAAP